MVSVEKILEYMKIEQTLHGFLRTIIKVILDFVAICIIADSIGIPIASLHAVLGMSGVAIALSVQGALSNLANGVMLLVAKPFKAWDYVEAGGVEGVVHEISLLCTKILTVDNKDIFVPNSEIAGGKITNFSSEKLRRVDIAARAGSNNDTGTVKKALHDAMTVTLDVLTDPEPFAEVSGYKEYAVEYAVRA
ncbi:MAG: mechanosensitive ion channel family protein [Phascolarctobacterium sp.]|nr:mechanosensitive ion channel family protein [Phascolarctobacterium sp.]